MLRVSRAIQVTLTLSERMIITQPTHRKNTLNWLSCEPTAVVREGWVFSMVYIFVLSTPKLFCLIVITYRLGDIYIKIVYNICINTVVVKT